MGSTIIGLEEHTPENIDQVIERAVRHRTDFHQFMLYTPLPGTPLHAELSAEGRIWDESAAPCPTRMASSASIIGIRTFPRGWNRS